MPQEQALSETQITAMARNALRSELMAAAIYMRLAEKYRGREISGKLEEFTAAEHGHAAFWAGFLKRRDQNPDEVKISTLYVEALAFIYGILGLGLTLKLLESGERRMMHSYANVLGTGGLSQEERNGVTRFLLAELAHEEEFTEYEADFKFFIGKTATIFTQTSGGLVLLASPAPSTPSSGSTTSAEQAADSTRTYSTGSRPHAHAPPTPTPTSSRNTCSDAATTRSWPPSSQRRPERRTSSSQSSPRRSTASRAPSPTPCRAPPGPAYSSP